MAEPNPRTNEPTKSSWSEKVRGEAQKLYGKGTTIGEISRELGIPFEVLNSWKFTGNWEVFPEELTDSEIDEQIELSPPDTEALEIKPNSIQVSGDNSIYTLKMRPNPIAEANTRLLQGYELIAQKAEQAIADETLKFKDQKQASEALIESLKGQITLLESDTTIQFLTDIAEIIKEEITDEQILQNLSQKLIALGRLYSSRFVSNSNKN